MNWCAWPDPASFLAAAGEVLRRRPLINQLVLALPAQIAADPGRYPGGWRLYTVHDGSGCVGAVVHTPPHFIQLSDMSADVAAFAGRRFAGEHTDARGVAGADAAGRAFAAAAFGPYALDESVGLFVLDVVSEVPRAPGIRRGASPADAVLLQAWLEAFRDEAAPSDPPPAPDHAARAITRGGIHLWLADGTPVAFANFGRQVEGFVSVGPVYTPPALRGRGYATTLVAEMSALALAEGRAGCTLYTDLANPISNRIYERIGYRRIGKVCRFVPARGAPASR